MVDKIDKISKKKKLYYVTITGINSDVISKLNVCAACYKPVINSWDHEDWCEYYEQEPLSNWISDGISDADS